ncbi:hypothetical protein H7198_04075 [Fructobacillus sp. CRL 2054]|uniref:hypothetical protein n=1 Tax=Fructobacillus sp. CRL 2054 TaxID=2763007 RepID=UPI0023788A11|nr:hypothetical protein [Fructobacillus sp. CRL 2054]MDD9138781.1 hypothetical protein [Fructobacillus sp. CRL 2054]
MTVHTYKQGNDLVITIPSEFKVKENRDYQAEILPDGTIKFIPKDSSFPDIWNDDPKDIAAFNQEIGSFDDGVNYGREFNLYEE